MPRRGHLPLFKGGAVRDSWYQQCCSTMVDCHGIAWSVIGISRLAVAIPRNDDFFIVAPPHHSAGIFFNTREIWGCSLGEENIHPP